MLKLNVKFITEFVQIVWTTYKCNHYSMYVFLIILFGFISANVWKKCFFQMLHVINNIIMIWVMNSWFNCIHVNVTIWRNMAWQIVDKYMRNRIGPVTNLWGRHFLTYHVWLRVILFFKLASITQIWNHLITT